MARGHERLTRSLGLAISAEPLRVQRNTQGNNCNLRAYDKK